MLISRDRAIRNARRIAKVARRLTLNALSGGAPNTRVIFIMGCQRSGTRVPLFVLESAPNILTYGEGAHRFFRGIRLKSEETLDQLFRRCVFPLLVLKPLCDSHRARQLLERFAGSRVIWIFRGYQDTVNSSSLKWSSGSIVVEQIVNGRLQRNDWRAGGLTEDAIEVARRLYRPGLSLHHANAILWYLRNRLVLDLDLFNCPEALIVKYEDLSTNPGAHFQRVFDFIGERLRPEYLTKIHSNAVRRSPLPEIPKPVLDTCEALYAEIDQLYRLSIQERS